VAAALLANWRAAVASFVKVMPLDYKRVLRAEAALRQAQNGASLAPVAAYAQVVNG
jgi:glutamate synthase domain-containing protein 3